MFASKLVISKMNGIFELNIGGVLVTLILRMNSVVAAYLLEMVT